MRPRHEIIRHALYSKDQPIRDDGAAVDCDTLSIKNERRGGNKHSTFRAGLVFDVLNVVRDTPRCLSPRG